MSEMLLWGVPVLSLLTGFTVYFIRRPSRAELAAVYTLAEEARDWAARSLELMARVRTEIVPRHLAKANDAVRECVDIHTGTATDRLGELINDDFYTLTAKAALPRRKWKEELEQEIRRIDHQIVDERALLRELTEITTRFENEIRAAVAPIANRIDDFGRDVPLEVRATIKKLAGKDERMTRFLGNNRDLVQLVNLSLKRDTTISVGTVGGGIAGIIATSHLDVATINTLMGGVLKDVLGSELVTELAHEISAWLVQEFGEGILLEIAGALAVSATGVGLVFTAWRGYRYYTIYQRLFVEKEPLARMQASARESVSEALQRVGESVESELRNQSDRWLGDMERELRKIYQQASERRAWALGRLGTSSGGARPAFG
jgi:BMFP domain-containing protein YqiC